MSFLTPRKIMYHFIRSPTFVKSATKREDIVLVHGGAGDFSDDVAGKRSLGVQIAAHEAYLLLKETNNVTDAVEMAIKIMEKDENFNAGYGSRLTAQGLVEMDAGIMMGAELQGAGVAAVKDIHHPITLAKIVMMKTSHSLLTGEGAVNFARENGLKILPPDELITKESKELWEKATDIDESDCGAVGCVVIDKAGNVAAGSSTGGANRRLSGRFTDSAAIGAGMFADNGTGAVSCSGHGDSIAKVCLAFSIANRLIAMSPTEAIQTKLADMKKRLNTTGGAIALSKMGDIGIAFTTKKMIWAYQKGRTLTYGVNPDEKHETRI